MKTKLHFALAAALTLCANAIFAASNAPTLSPESVNDAKLLTAVGPKSNGPAVLRAQVLLDRARFSPGEIDGAYGSNMAKAISGFQNAKGLQVTGGIDDATWNALNADTAEALKSYTIAAEDVAGPFDAIPADMMEKSKLKELRFTSAAEALGEKFHSSPALLTRLNPDKDLARAGEQIVVPNIDRPASNGIKAAKIVVDKSELTVSVVDDAGKTLAQFPASTGSEHDPLPIGAWKIKGVAKNPAFHYNPKLFWDADPDHSKAKLAAGPNNPVGIVWIDLSKDHYGIHGTPEPSKVGKTESHGCIRLTNWDAAALAQWISPGMDAVLQE
jgi:lipoprotein-anchoring transpeptidase ErfK/SrfK